MKIPLYRNDQHGAVIGFSYQKPTTSVVGGFTDAVMDVAYDADRTKWADPEFSSHQPFMDFGVRTDEAGHVLVSGRPVMNLYAAGEILAAGSKEFDTDSFIEEYEHRIG